MKRKLLILPIIMALLIVCMIPTIASNETNTTGVTVADSVGAPGKEFRMKVSVRAIFADNVGLIVTYDKDVLTMSEESQWLIEGKNELFDINVANGTAVWGADAMDVKGEIFELVFRVNQNAEVGSTTEVNCQVLAMWNEDTQLDGSDTATVTIKNLAKISGAITSYGDATAPVTVELLNEESVAVDTQILEAGMNTYEFEAEQGNYVVRVSKTKHCSRNYEVSMEDLEDKVQDAEIRLYGDVNGDNKINAGDARQILKYYNGKTSVITDSDLYIKELSDINGDDKINAGDARQVLKFYNGKASKFDDFE